MPSSKLFPVLAPGYVLRKLETPFAYNIPDDQLYELDDEAFEFLKKCDGKHPYSELILDAGEGSQESIEYMIEERMIKMHKTPFPGKKEAKQSPVPSLRYLLLNITDRCNLACKHCYLGRQGTNDIDIGLFEKAVSQFEEMGGLKLMISGGEPLLHSKFWDLMKLLPSFELRVVLLSNGTLIDKKEAGKLSGYVNEVQVSIDGISGHDLLRGKGSYDKARRGICALRQYNIPVSVATVVHSYNMQEFEKMQELFSRYDILSWSVDVPCFAGNLKSNPDYIPDIREASKFLKYGFGAGAHESTGEHTCGSHLCSVSPDGTVSKCGFFGDEPVGNVNDLKSAWTSVCKNYLWTLDKLECHDCSHIRECRGGCRFRAKQHKGILAPDPLMCHSFGVPMIRG